MPSMLEPFNNPTVHGDPRPLNSSPVICQSGNASVRYYRALGKPHRTPIVLVYALIKRAFILDLQPGASVVESLTSRGLEVYLIDWLPPTAADKRPRL